MKKRKPTNRISRYDAAEWIMLLSRNGLATPQDIQAARKADVERARGGQCDDPPPAKQ